MTIDNVAIGNRLKELRKQSGLMQKHIADYLGVDQSLIARFENGDRAMTSATLEKLAMLYCCPASKILSGEPCNTSLKFSFRTDNASMKDLVSLAEINKIVLNQMMMDQFSN
ncbi:helix-turn-helix domain-containing protein [Sphaerochaeta globosa]|uniref:Helix-turn-helix domain protein n=1 Tax=Sphaerochaeta globosa (strain ATCC BAA-1886 / DSM 22777 / Buddy) TaxID=158189 RepID=F0RRN5_SPHGB|nr:helix-turn-helix transcriptional regulator [Sphaerochaeta globosa]ADY14294.1 helix-turn-helix domain protein [Sphaerochaeta globosa str. Buddy]